MLKLQADLNAARQRFVAALPEANQTQVKAVVAAIKSDKKTANDVGLNKEFKITSEASLKLVKAAAKARLTSLNTATKKASIVKSLQSAKRITNFHVGKPSKKNKGNTPVSASWEV